MGFQNVEVEAEHVDDRSVDELLSFINGENGGTSISSVCISACAHTHKYYYMRTHTRVYYCRYNHKVKGVGEESAIHVPVYSHFGRACIVSNGQL